MYSDDDLQDEEHALFHSWSSEPEMCAFEKEEEKTRRSYAVDLREKTRQGGEVDTTQVTQAISTNEDMARQAVCPRCCLCGPHISSFLDLSVHARELKSQVYIGRREFPVIYYTFDDPEIWESFKTTWKVPSTVNYGFLLEETRELLSIAYLKKLLTCFLSERTLRIIATSSGSPQVQKLCLVDLPSEILDKIYSHASEHKIRLLSSTCRQLHELGGRHLSRRIILKRPLSFYIDLRESGLPPDEYIATVALDARKDTLAFCNFLENRKELLNRMENLVISNQWIDIFDQTVIQDYPISELDGRKFYNPFYKSLCRIIGSSVNLVALTFINMELDLNLVACVCDLSKLDRLKLHMCRINEQARRALVLDARDAPVSTVRDLEVVVTNDKSPWYAMLFCPNLQNFTVHAFSGVVFPPPDVIWDKCRFFETLKCLYLGHISLFHLQTYAEWIRQSSHGDTPCLTYLKIEVESGMTDTMVILFLQAVQSAPLEVLSIEGALQADLHLFDWIAQHFPHLLALTIIRHSSTRSRCASFVVWPLQIWQYARCLSAFLRLQHFGWNNETLSPEYSTYSLRLLEQGGLDYADDAGWDEANENDWFSPEDIWTPKLFAVHCPTLRTFALTFRLITYFILRPSEGAIEIERDLSGYSGKWNPSLILGF
ncbi:hypothetical protein C0995_016383 [Termitomyces sp. Mi166|nr:hypothetical protein C0995_016383 [Termitomyces sp. Mi166\